MSVFKGHQLEKLRRALGLTGGGGGGGNGTIDGSGTLGTVPLWAGATTLGDSQIVQSSGLVGINNATPDRRLDVLDDTNPQLRLTHTYGADYTDFFTNASGETIVSNTGGIFNYSNDRAGTYNEIATENTSTTAGSFAGFAAYIHSLTGAADPYIQMTIVGGTDWFVTVDNDQSDTFAIGQTFVASTSYFTITTGGVVSIRGSLVLDGTTAQYFESTDGSTAAVSGATTGRIRYNQGVGAFQVSMNGSAYANLATGAGGGCTLDQAYDFGGAGAGRTIIVDAGAVALTGTGTLLTVDGNAGIGTATPDRRVEILDASNPQLRLTHTDSAVYTDLQTDSFGDFYITPTATSVNVVKSLVGSYLGVFVENLATSGASHAYLEARVSSLSTGDPLIFLDINGSPNSWLIGVDNDDADKFKIAYSATLGTAADHLTITTGGLVGIGGSVPSDKLHVFATEAVLGLESSAGRWWSLYSGGNVGETANHFVIRDRTAGVSRLDIGTSGDFRFAYDGSNYVDLTVTSGGDLQITTPTGDEVLFTGSTTAELYLEVANTSATAAANAVVTAITQGASGGDPYICFDNQTVGRWSIGLDNSDSDKLKFSNFFGVGTNDILSLNATGPSMRLSYNSSNYTDFDMSYADGSLVIRPGTYYWGVEFPDFGGAAAATYIYNGSTGAGAHNYLELTVSGPDAGDPFILFDVTGGAFFWSIGADNDDNDSFKLSYGLGLGVNDYITALTGGYIGINTNYPDRRLDIFDDTDPQLRLTNAVDGTNGSVYTDFHTVADGDMYITPTGDSIRFAKGSPTAIYIGVENNDNTSGADCALYAYAGGTSGGDAAIFLDVFGGAGWSVGLDNSDSDKFKISAASYALGTSDVLTLTTAGEVAIPLGAVVIGTTVGLVNPRNLQLYGTIPGWTMWESDAAVDGRYWDFVVNAGRLTGRVVNDANSVAADWITVDRSGAAINYVNFENGRVGIGMQFANAKLEVRDASVPQLRLSYDGSTHSDFLSTDDFSTSTLYLNDTEYFGMEGSYPGSEIAAWIFNSSDTTDATAYHQVYITGNNSLSALYYALMDGGAATSWFWGLYNQDSDNWKLGVNANPNVLVATTGGSIGVGTNPDLKLEVLDNTGLQLRLTHTDGSLYADLGSDSGGGLIIKPIGQYMGLEMDVSGPMFFYVFNNHASAGTSMVGSQVGPLAPSTADATFYCDVFGVNSWIWGLDNSDGDYWKLDVGGTLGSDTALTITQNRSLVLNKAAVTTTATEGFIYIAGCAGTPTGDPTSVINPAGRSPLVVDTTNNTLYFYSSGSWNAAGGVGSVSGTGTATRIAFWSAATTLSSNANLYWDNSNARLGIGTATPRASVDILNASTAQLYLTFTDNSVYTSFTTDTSGFCTVSPTGNQFKIEKTAASAALYLGLSNLSAGAGTSAIHYIAVAGTTSGDPYTQYIVNSGGATWSIGVDNSDGDRFKISESNVPGTTDRFYIETGGKIWIGGELELDGALNHDGTTVGFYGVAPVAQSAAYTPSNVTTDRTYDANATSLDEIADILGTLIADLKLTGIIG